MIPDLVFRDATVVDGSNKDPFVADVAVSGDSVCEIGSVGVSMSDIDASGLVLAPGFIDIHTHDDWALASSPEMPFKTLQGVTTVVTGNCGSSAVPIAEWLSKISNARPAVNVAPLVGHGSVRSHVMGPATQRQPTDLELQQMSDLVAQALDHGAFGLSTGLVYEPGRWSAADEIVALVSMVAARGGLYTTHMRSESYNLLDSIDESIGVAIETGGRLQISHLKAIGPENWHSIPAAIDKIEAARSRGIDVMADQYPYARGSTMLHQIVSAGAFRGPSVFGHLTGDLVTVASAPRNVHWEGRTIADIAAEMNVTDADAADHLVSLEGSHCAVVTASQSEENIARILSCDFIMIGSDGIPSGSRPHPRLHHTFPRVLGEYHRRQGVIDLVTAVQKMTSMPADRLGLTDRGRITVGSKADLVLFDAETIRDTGTYADPTTVPLGLRGTWVNGICVASDGRSTGMRPGQLLRH